VTCDASDRVLIRGLRGFERSSPKTISGAVEYDPLTGYPVRIVFDYDGPKINGADGETGFILTLETPSGL
jgi:hypothetical protein